MLTAVVHEPWPSVLYSYNESSGIIEIDFHGEAESRILEFETSWLWDG